MQTHRLGNQVGDHGQQPDVVAEADLVGVGPHPRHRQHAERPTESLDRHPDQRDPLAVHGARRAEVFHKKRMLGDVLGDERHLPGEDAPRHLFRQVGGTGLADGPARTRGDDLERPRLIDDGDHAAPHLQVGRHEVEDGTQRRRQVGGRTQDFGYLVQAHER